MTTVIEPTGQVRESETPVARLQHTLHRHPAIGPASVLVASVIAFSIANPRFLNSTNLSLLIQQVAVLATLAIGQTMIILTAGIDLSVGAAAILAQMVIAQTAANNHVPGVLAILLGVAVGALTGLLNGFLVTRIKLPPFIVTLGTLSIYTSIGLRYSNGQSVYAKAMPAALIWTGNYVDIGPYQLTIGVILMLVLFAVTSYALTRTAWGRHVYSTGDDAEAARLSGIKTGRVLLSVYLVAGVIFGLAAWILIGRVGVASTNNLTNANLDSITAVVIGGTSLFGGRGAVLGTLFGALIVQVFQSGISLAGVQSLYQVLAEGILVIVAVALDQWIRKVRR
jgi:ribose/xylose/arabinose/galactoside ABC-type transport system permease subunit